MSEQTFTPEKLINSILFEDGRKLYLTEHSQERIKTRRISEKDIEETFSNPDIIMPNNDFDNARNYMKTIDNKRVKIGIKDDIELFVLITAFIQ